MKTLLANVANWARRDRYGVALVALGITLGLVIGLALAWMVWPVQWTHEGAVVVDGDFYVVMAGDLFAFDLNGPRARQAIAADGAYISVCQAMRTESDGAALARLAVLAAVTGVECER